MNLSRIIINEKCTIREAMRRMNDDRVDTLMVTDVKLILLGVITNGDIRRALLKDYSLNDLASSVMNRDYISASITDNREDLLTLLKNGITSIPFLDEDGRIIGCIGPDIDEYIPIYSTNLNGREIDYLTDCINKSWVSSTGNYVKLFEEKFSRVSP